MQKRTTTNPLQFFKSANAEIHPRESRSFARHLWPCIIALFCVISNSVMAADFEVEPNQRDIVQKALDAADQTGKIGLGGTLSNPDRTEGYVITISAARAKVVSEGAINNLDDSVEAGGITVQAAGVETHIVLKTNSSILLLAGGDGGSDGILTEAVDTKIDIEGGTINTANLDGSHGVQSTAAKLVLTMSDGRIQGTGGASHGILSTGADAQLTISGGSITTAGAASHGIRATGRRLVLTMTGGKITTTGAGSRGITLGGADDAKVNISGGEISTTGAESHAIVSTGNNLVLTISGGEIKVAQNGGNAAYAVSLAAGTNAQLIMTGGKVTTTGDAGGGGGNHAINVGAIAAPKITISGGEISTAGAAAHGINVDAGASDVEITINGGSITTAGAASHAINSADNGAKFTISGGEIKTTGTGAGAYAFNSTGNTAKLTMTGGKLMTTGAGAQHAVVSTGEKFKFLMDGGEISTAGAAAHGLNLTLSGNAGAGAGAVEHEIKVGGLVNTKGAGSHGIRIENEAGTSRARLDISGRVIVEGVGSVGVLIEDQTGIPQFEISGRIEAKKGADDDESKPIAIKKHENVDLALKIDIKKNARIIGNIEMGAAGEGEGEDNDTINLMNNAQIEGNVNMGDGADTLNLDGNSIIIGDINMGDDNDTVKLSAQASVTGMIDGGANEEDGADTLDVTGLVGGRRARAADSFSLRYKNFENVKGVEAPSKKNYLVGINFKGQAGYDAAKETRLVHIEPTAQAAETRALSGLNDALHDLGGRRLDSGSGQRYAGRPVQLAARERIPKHLFQDSRPSAWAEFFGAAQRRGKDGYAKSYALDYRGIAAGLEQDFRGARLGFLLGYASTTFKTRPASIKTDSRSFFAGMYGRHTLDNYLEDAYLQGALNFSYNDHDNRRRIIEAQNIVIAKGEYKSWALSPSLTLGRNLRLNSQFSLEPSVDLRYSVGFYDDYNEKGLQQRQDALSIKERTQQSLLGRLNLAGIYQLPDEAGRVALRFGLSHRRHFASDLKGRVGDKAAFTFDNAGSTTVNLMQTGLDIAVNVTDALSVNARWEYATNLGGVSDHANRAQLFAVYQF